MLFPESYAIWITSLYLVLATRNITTPFLPLVAIAIVLPWTTTADASSASASDTFEHIVRRLTFIVYGAVAGFAVAAATGARVLIPVHSFSGKSPHWAGPLSVVSASFIPYTLAVATGLAEPLGEWAGNVGGKVALYFVLFGLLVAIFAAILIASWLGAHAFPLTFRFGDGGIIANEHPPSRYAAEAVVGVTLLAASHLVWIFTARAPVLWPQFWGGLLTLGTKIALWTTGWIHGGRRYAMEETYFHQTQSRTTWTHFVAFVAFVDLASTLVWLITAQFTDTGLSAELLLLFTTLAVVIASVVAWATLTDTFSIPMSTLTDPPAASGTQRRTTGKIDRAALAAEYKRRQAQAQSA